ncbi:hypothetical protein [Nitrosospira sp. NpAV]|uniref:hypothetical protein n=1 Tax=Nitrosospira sp. NpAV TaxID=58133 RepID=UPI000AC01CC9|nr:hypothetical protein [Nitrosospira sp. NpAV]
MREKDMQDIRARNEVEKFAGVLSVEEGTFIAATNNHVTHKNRDIRAGRYFQAVTAAVPAKPKTQHLGQPGIPSNFPSSMSKMILLACHRPSYQTDNFFLSATTDAGAI